MNSLAHAALRVSLGYLLVIWGVDKLVNPSHGVAVANRFYLGLFAGSGWMAVLGTAEAALGIAVIDGLWRRVTYPMMTAITAATLLGVWRSIVDPWGWYLAGASALFYPSLLIFCAALVLLADEFNTNAPPGRAERA